MRRCRGRESNPLETDLQSVTLAALSPRRRPPNRRSVIETLETCRVEANQMRDDELNRCVSPDYGSMEPGVPHPSSSFVRQTIRVDSPFPRIPARREPI